MINKYNFYALYIPSFLILMPVIMMLELYRVDTTQIIESINKVNFEWDGFSITGSIILWVFLAKIIRFLGKHCIENKIFENGNLFPTTLYLSMSSKAISATEKNRIFQLVSQDFGFSTAHISTLSGEDERLELKGYVKQIIAKVGDGTLTLEHNRRYGFARNFMGGLFILLPILLIHCVNSIYHSLYTNLSITLIAITLILLIIFIFRKAIIEKFASEYAHILFREYINLKRN